MNTYIIEEMFLGGLGSHVELYDLPNENMIVYSDGISTTYNEEYYKYLIENNYQVCLTEASDYIEDILVKNTIHLMKKVRTSNCRKA